MSKSTTGLSRNKKGPMGNYLGELRVLLGLRNGGGMLRTESQSPWDDTKFTKVKPENNEKQEGYFTTAPLLALLENSE